MTTNHSFRMRDIIDLRAVSTTLTAGVLVGCIFAVYAASLKYPLWIQAACVIAGVMPAYSVHALAILRKFGWWYAVLTLLVAAQSFHGIEHLVQWVQYHVLRWPFFKASGCLSYLYQLNTSCLL